MITDLPEYDENFTRKPKSDDWVFVEKDLPEVWKKVLIYNASNDDVDIGCIVQFDQLGNAIWSLYADDETAEVTHWMELPKKPT